MDPHDARRELGLLRRRIDEVDLELLTLLEERMELGLRTRALKSGERDAARELSVLTRAKRSSLALVGESFAQELFAAIMAESRRLQSEGRTVVAFQGEHGAYSEIAARSLVPGAATVPCLEFGDVFRGVQQARFDLGVVPVENSLEGPVSQVSALLPESGLWIRGEVSVPVRHCLLAWPGTDRRDLRVAYSHPMALGQCRGFLARHKLEPRPTYDTAGAARMLAREKPSGAAAVASALAAHLYGLEVIQEGIEDEASNTTRFLLLSRAPAEQGNKCSLVFTTRHESGQLLNALDLFAGAGLNLTRIASMPCRSDPGSYRFFVDVEGSDQDPTVRQALVDLQGRATSYRFLGCYPAAAR